MLTVKTFTEKTDVFILLNAGNSTTFGADILVTDDECSVYINDKYVTTDGFVYFVSKEQLQKEFDNWSTCEPKYFDIDEENILILKDFQGSIYLDILDNDDNDKSLFTSGKIAVTDIDLEDYVLHQIDENITDSPFLKIVINYPIVNLTEEELLNIFE